jgi:hypothetical protein
LIYVGNKDILLYYETQILGLVLNILGGVLYTYVKQLESKRQQKRDSVPNSQNHSFRNNNHAQTNKAYDKEIV